MSTRFRPYSPDQMLLLPPTLQEWLPEGHLAYFISDTVDELDLGGFYAPYEGDGRRNRPFEPRMMLKVLIYSYATGTFSSRKIAKRMEEDVALRVLGAGNLPAHRTICDFRARHLKEFGELFVQVVRIAGEAGLVALGRVAVDGSKVEANAGKHKAMSYARMLDEEPRLEEEIRDLLERARAADAEEDERYGRDNRGDEIPDELRRRRDRLAKIREAKKRLEERQAAADRSRGRHPGDGRKSPRGGRRFKREFGVPEDKAQDNFTDPESRIMKSAGSFEQCYNAQAAVDDKSQIIVAAEVTDNAADNGQLLVMADAVKSALGRHAGQLVADCGYKGEDNFKGLEERGITGYVALGREGRCEALDPGEEYPATARMLERIQSEAGRAIYRRRKAIVEPPFGWIKEILGFRRFSLRGKSKVAGEWRLVCLAVNLKRMKSLVAAV